MVKITEQLIRKKSEHNECLISTLEELSLHQEDIERLEHLHNWCRDLKILLLQSNLIPKIENLFKLKKLEYLNLAINNIERVENLEALESLEKLDLTLNFIGDLTSIESLRNNYNLRELILTGNPCVDYPHYREYVIATLPQLSHLDGAEVSTTDKLRAKKHLDKYRAEIVQKQMDYAIQRDEQKMRVQCQKQELDAQMADVDNEEERIKMFWNTKSEHCPETRHEIYKYQKLVRNKADKEEKTQTPQPRYFAPCGRPYNINQAKLPFKFMDEIAEYILELGVYKYLDTSLINVDVEPKYVRVTVKGKIFQLSLNDEVKTDASSVQRSQITGELLVKMPKLHYDETLLLKTKKGAQYNRIADDVASIHSPDQAQSVQPKTGGHCSEQELRGPVDIRHICHHIPDDLPDLVDA